MPGFLYCVTLFVLSFCLSSCKKKNAATAPPTSQVTDLSLDSQQAFCLAPAVFTEPDVAQLLVNPIAGLQIATPFFDYSRIPTLLLQPDLGSGTYMDYQIHLDKKEKSTDACFDTVEGTTKDPSIPGKTIHEGKNAVIVYGLCPGVYTIQIKSCRDSDQTCGEVYPPATQSNMYFQQPALLDPASLEKLTQYTLIKNATYEKTKKAYSIISQWAYSNCINATQMQTEYCKSASNIVHMGLGQFINLVQDNYQATETTILAHIKRTQAAGTSAVLALANLPSMKLAQDSPCANPASIVPFTPEPPPETPSEPPETLEAREVPTKTVAAETPEGTESPSDTNSSSSSIAPTTLALVLSGAALACIGSIMWLAGGYEAAGIMRQKFKNQIQEVKATIATAGAPTAPVVATAKPMATVKGAPAVEAPAKVPTAKGEGKWTGVSAIGVGLVVIGAILPVLSLFITLADTNEASVNEQALSQQLGKEVSTELKERIIEESSTLQSLLKEAQIR